jgi:Baseplate J-like protein
MAANPPLKATDVKYLNKDFESFKRDLMRYAQAHFSGSFKDYNEASPGMTILELQAYVGDVLAYYMDQQFQEIKKETSRQTENIEAKTRGYKPKGQRAARVPLYWMVAVPASSSDGKFVPDISLLPQLRAGSQARGPSGVVFETVQDVDFKDYQPGDVQVYKTDKNGQVTHFAVRVLSDAIGAHTVSEVLQTPTNFAPWLKMPLAQSNVIEVVDVTDEQGNRWYQVDWLAQDVVFDQIVNTSTDQSIVPYVLRYRPAPRRFVVDTSISEGITYLQFGNGQGTSFNDELIPNIANMALPLAGRKNFTNIAIDPQNFLKTSTLGLSPYSTRLLARYRIGGGQETNVDAFTINKPIQALFDTIPPGVDITKANQVRTSIECINLVPSSGGGPAETPDEIKSNADSYFAAQARAVTREDYLAQIFTMPERFGRVEKAYVKPSEYNPFAVDLHVLGVDSNGWLVKPTPTLQENIRTYFTKLRMITEGINIMPAYIINIGVSFGIVVSPQYNRSEVLTNCLNVIKSYLQTSNMQIGEPIVLSDIRAQIQEVIGVISVYKLDVLAQYGRNPDTGLTYNSDVHFDVSGNTKHGIVYCPLDSVFEVRYPDRDILGETK